RRACLAVRAGRRVRLGRLLPPCRIGDGPGGESQRSQREARREGRLLRRRAREAVLLGQPSVDEVRAGHGWSDRPCPARFIGAMQSRAALTPRGRDARQDPMPLRRSVLLLVASAMLLLGVLAYASPPDPDWISGLWDNGDYDDIILLVTSGVGIPDSH